MKNKSVKTMVASVLAVGLMMGIPASAFAVSPGGMFAPSAPVSYTHLTLPTKA